MSEKNGWKLAEGAQQLLKRYESMGVLSDYFIENSEKQVGKALAGMRKNMRIEKMEKAYEASARLMTTGNF